MYLQPMQFYKKEGLLWPSFLFFSFTCKACFWNYLNLLLVIKVTRIYWNHFRLLFWIKSNNYQNPFFRTFCRKSTKTIGERKTRSLCLSPFLSSSDSNSFSPQTPDYIAFFWILIQIFFQVDNQNSHKKVSKINPRYSSKFLINF